MVTIKDDKIVVTLDLAAESLPALQKSIIRTMPRIIHDVQSVNIYVEEDVYYLSAMLEALTLSEHQSEIALKSSSKTKKVREE